MLPASFSHLAPELSRALESWRPQSAAKGFAVVSVPAPLVAPENVFVAGQSGESFFWAPTAGTQFVAEGVAAEVTGSGPNRFGEVRDQVQRLLASVKRPDDGAPSPRVFGGFSFQPHSPSQSLWQGFDAARFVLPRTCYSTNARQAWISLSISQEELQEPARVQALIVQTVLWLERLVAAPTCKPVQPSSNRPSSVPDRTGWRRLVEAIQGEIGRGGFQKIVAARRAVCQLEQAPAAEVVLARLGDIAHTCTRFALRHRGKLFLGATPEWLVRQHGRSVQTEAMAGSRRSGEPSAETQLLSSRKDLGEHALVVEEIVGALGPVATHVLASSQPSVRRLRDILHLYTPIAATLTSDTHVIDLVERLHPTPAVGGTPHQAAQRWIAEHEPDERGWYASPVGWVDAAGDGQFVVALRSALLVDRFAHVFAGAGIVAESDAELEFEETELKLKAMLHALGAS